MKYFRLWKWLDCCFVHAKDFDSIFLTTRRRKAYTPTNDRRHRTNRRGQNHNLKNKKQQQCKYWRYHPSASSGWGGGWLPLRPYMAASLGSFFSLRLCSRKLTNYVSHTKNQDSGHTISSDYYVSVNSVWNYVDTYRETLVFILWVWCLYYLK